MARDFGPFPSKPMYEVVNRRMQKALAEATASTGFAKSGQGAVTAGTGAQLIIAAYPDGALVDGLYVENPASETVTLTANSNANPRIDRLVLRLNMAAETIAPFQIVGTPAASPSVPPLVQTAGVYDMPLCQYLFPGSAAAQNPGSIVDERISSCPQRVFRLERNGTGSDTYSNANGVVNLLAGTWPDAPAGAYMLRPTLAVQATQNTAGDIILVANGVTLTKPNTRADIPADVVATLTYSYPFGHNGGDLTASMSHAPSEGGTVSVYNSTTQLVIEYLGRLP